MPDGNPVLIEITRGPLVESRHRGAAAVVDSAGAVRAAWGDVQAPVFPRSAIKPLQALPLVESGAADALALTAVELALACASHAGEPRHVQAVAAWLRRLGLGAGDLVCGAHPPLGEAAAAELLRRGEAPGRLHNNCSGKHAGFLSLACHLGAPVRGYAEVQHPVQRLVLTAVAEMAGIEPSTAPVATDGCGVPVMALPLVAMARAFALLACPQRLPPRRGAAVERLYAAMVAHPGLVGGSGRFDTLLIEAAGGSLIVKSGAEGVVCAAVPEAGLGLALKVDDGGKRPAEAAMAALLLRFGRPDARLGETLRMLAAPAVHNTLGEPVGAVRAAAGWLA